MNYRHLSALVAVSALAFAGCGHAPPAQHTDIESLAANADTGFLVTGTIATLGSFEWDAAPLLTRAAHEVKQTAAQLRLGQITVEQAKARAAALDHAHDLLTEALSVCKQNDHTGKCTGSETDARAFLDLARAALADLP